MSILWNLENVKCIFPTIHVIFGLFTVKDRQGVSARVWVRLEIFNNPKVSFSSLHSCNII